MAGYGKTKFIATQGPVPEAFVAFWQMMWEQKCHVIAMVTNEVGAVPAITLDNARSSASRPPSSPSPVPSVFNVTAD